MHSISTSVSNGSCFTATQVRHYYCQSLSILYKSMGQVMEATHRLLVPDEELVISFVHRSKVIHRGDENIDLEDVVQAAASFFEDGL